MAIPALRNRSNIHFSELDGSPRRVGAYQTHGIGFPVWGLSGRIRNAVCFWMVNASPLRGSRFSAAVSGISAAKTHTTKKLKKLFIGVIASVARSPAKIDYFRCAINHPINCLLTFALPE
jgi:hypothetical protein